MRLLLIAVPIMDRIEDVMFPIAMDRMRTSPPMGTYWLAAIARAAGHTVTVFDVIAKGELDRAALIEEAGRAELVGVSCTSLSWPTAKVVIDAVKAIYPDIPVVVGGVHASTYGEHVMTATKADFIVRGEGEKPLLALLDHLSGRIPRSEVPGLGWIEDRILRLNPNDGLAIDTIEGLPDPAYDLMPDGVYESLSVESSRGCRFNCVFCSTKFRSSWRGISPGAFVDRLERLAPYLGKTRYGVYGVVDDLYTFDTRRTVAITEEIKRRGLDVAATIDARISDILRPGVAEALVPITNHMLVGAECGYDAGLRRIRKGITTSMIERAAALLKDLGLSKSTVFSFVIGFPFEDREDCLKTIKFASHLLSTYNVRVYLQWFNTIPGSALWDELAETGEINIGMYDDFGFFTNEYLFRAGVRLPLQTIKELSSIINSINALFLLTQPAEDIIQFSEPTWLYHEPTTNFPSHGVLTDGRRPVPA